MWRLLIRLATKKHPYSKRAVRVRLLYVSGFIDLRRASKCKPTQKLQLKIQTCHIFGVDSKVLSTNNDFSSRRSFSWRDTSYHWRRSHLCINTFAQWKKELFLWLPPYRYAAMITIRDWAFTDKKISVILVTTILVKLCVLTTCIFVNLDLSWGKRFYKIYSLRS